MEAANMKLLRNFIVLNILFLFIVSACHTKVKKDYNKEGKTTCSFKNVSEPLYNYHLIGLTNNSTPQTIYFFNASKPNLAILPCHENNVNYLSQNISDEYKNKNSEFTNSVVECMTVCQVTKECEYFTYNIKTNQCWMFSRMSFTKSSEAGYISG